MTSSALELDEPEAQKRYPVIPTIEHPSALFQAYLAHKRELNEADALADSIDDDRGEAYRKAAAAAQEAWGQKIDAAYAVADRPIENEQGLVELAIIVADSDNGTEEEGPTYRIELVQALLNRIFELGAGKQNRKAA